MATPSLDVVPGVSVGPFVLGMPIGDAIKQIQLNTSRSNESFSLEESANIDLRIPSLNATLRFDSATQTLVKIKLSKPWRATVFVVTHTAPKHRRLHLLSPDDPLTHSTLQKVQIGVRRLRPIDSRTRCESTYVGASFRFDTDGPKQLRSLTIFSGSSEHTIPTPFSIYRPNGLYLARSVAPLTSPDSNSPDIRGLIFELSFSVDAREKKFRASISFGDSIQDVMTELGHPDKIYVQEKPKRQLDKKKNASHLSSQPSGNIYLNYLGLGVDVVIDRDSLSVQNFVLHSNVPRHYDFGVYRRCPFQIRLRCCCRHAVATAGTKHRFLCVVPTTTWTDVVSHVICGDARCVSLLRRRRRLAIGDAFPVSEAFFCVFGQLAFEVIADCYCFATVFVSSSSSSSRGRCASGKSDPHLDVFYASFASSSTATATATRVSSHFVPTSQPKASKKDRPSATPPKSNETTETVRQYEKIFAPSSELARSPPSSRREEKSEDVLAENRLEETPVVIDSRTRENADQGKFDETRINGDTGQSENEIATETNSGTSSEKPTSPTDSNDLFVSVRDADDVYDDDSSSNDDIGESARHLWSIPKQLELSECSSLSSLIPESGKADYLTWEDISAVHEDVCSQLRQRSEAKKNQNPLISAYFTLSLLRPSHPLAMRGKVAILARQ